MGYGLLRKSRKHVPKACVLPSLPTQFAASLWWSPPVREALFLSGKLKNAIFFRRFGSAERKKKYHAICSRFPMTWLDSDDSGKNSYDVNEDGKSSCTCHKYREICDSDHSLGEILSKWFCPQSIDNKLGLKKSNGKIPHLIHKHFFCQQHNT